MKKKEGFLELQSCVDDGNRVIQRTRRGVSVFEDEQISKWLNVQTNAPIFKDPLLRNRLEKVMQGTEKSKIYDTVKDRLISQGIEPHDIIEQEKIP